MSDSKQQSHSSSGGCGCGIIGIPFAVLISWTLNHSILWAIIHGAVWPFYLLYVCMGCGGGWPAEFAP